MTGGTSVPNVSAWPTWRTSTAPARRSVRAAGAAWGAAAGACEALVKGVGDRFVDEQRGERRALLPCIHVRGAHHVRYDLVEIGVGVDDHAVLATHLGDDALDVGL